jgi:flagellar protein FliO/FliZ
MTLLLLFAAGSTDQANYVNSQVFQYVEVLLALGGVLVLAYVVLRVGLPRMLGMRVTNSGPIQVVARYPLEPKKTLYLIKTGTQVFLIGTSENQVQYLTAVAPENATEMLASAQTEERPRKDFRNFLSSLRQHQRGDG